MTEAQYQAALTATDGALAAAVRNVGAARTPATVTAAIDALRQSVDTEADRLSAISSPVPVRDAHFSLVVALRGLSRELSGGDLDPVCAGSSALSLISRGTQLANVRSAAQTLATADPAHPYTIGSFAPKSTNDAKRRLGNGTLIKRASGGLGQLKISNGGSTDSVISVVPSNAKKATVTVYVRAKGKYTVRGIRDATYRVYMTSGADWDAKARTFTRDCAFEQFDDTFEFTTTSRQYTIWEITLTPVVGGNATSSTVDPDAFPVG
ncbi:hypothetical protein Pa4123_92210 [Phytohabitans aurantiacus]|uniref:Uncharacterized protein n=1 Tax=Phytohabitans aurantiacus TaxID=3016789 RepID=A0ABQ5RC39_9ACTN|nr:hypothetical protein Pa4123_92210 [Phytohabitans aurantiacus]